MTTTVRITAVGGDTLPGQINLQFLNVQSGTTSTLQIPRPNFFIAEEIRWYLEEFAQNQPSAAERANDAKTALIEHGRNLAFYVRSSNVVGFTEGPQILNVEIDDGPEMPSTILWEALERKDAMVSLPGVSAVMVTRVLIDSSPELSSTYRTLLDLDNRLDILVVSARPYFESDISHRLVANEVLASLASANEMEKRIGANSNVNILHPATFEALRSQLESRAPGYYALVHLDLHGVEDSLGCVKFGFIKRDMSSASFGLTPDLRSAEEVGELLEQYHVSRVVMNACRSTHQSTVNDTIPRVLRKYGIHEIVAMSYNISSRCVEYFTSMFYSMLFSCRSIPFAMYLSRRMLQNTTARISRFGTKLQLLDHVVPICYQTRELLSGDHDLRLHLSDMIKHFPEVPVDLDDIEVEPSIMGREYDLLKLECMLLAGDRPVFIVGEPGIGKTALIATLTNWWLTSKCIKAANFIQLSTYKGFTVEKMYQNIHKNLHCPGSYDGPKGVINFLRETRFLIVIDSLESMDVDNPKLLVKQQVELIKFTKALKGGKTLLIFSSRAEHKIFSSYTALFELFGLGTVPALHIMRGMLKMTRKNAIQSRGIGMTEQLKLHFRTQLGIEEGDSEEYRKLCKYVLEAQSENMQRTEAEVQAQYPTWESEEDGVYLEEINKLIDGHPLSLILLGLNLVTNPKEVTPKLFFLGLLQGVPPIVVNPRELLEGSGVDPEGLRSMKDLEKIMFELPIKTPSGYMFGMGLLAMFWKVIPVQSLAIFNRSQLKGFGKKDPESRLTSVRETFSKFELGGAFKNMSPDLRAAFERLKFEEVDLLTERKTSLAIWEYLEAEGVLRNSPEMTSLLPALKESLSQTSSSELETEEQVHNLTNSHDFTLMFGIIKERLLRENASDLTAEDQEKIRSCETWEDLMAHGNPAATRLPNVLKSAHESAIYSVLKPFMDSHFIKKIIPFEPSKAGGEPIEYIRTSPLVALMLRGTNLWIENKAFVEDSKMAMSMTYLQRCRAWSDTHLNFGGKKPPSAQIKFEFYNIACTVAIIKEQLKLVDGVFVEQTMIAFMQMLNFCVMADNSCGPVVRMLWETCLEDGEDQVKTLEVSVDRPPKPHRTLLFFSKKPEVELTPLQRGTEMRIFDRRRYCMSLALNLLKFYINSNDKRARRCRDIIVTMAKSIKNDTYPDPAIKAFLDSRPGFLDISVQIAESFLQKPGRRKETKIQELAQSVEHLNLVRQNYPEDVRTINAKSILVDNGPAKAELDPMGYMSSATAFGENIQKVLDLIKANDTSSARELLDNLLEKEIRDDNNDANRRQTLYYLSAINSFKQQRWTDSLRDLKESTRLRQLAVEKSSFDPMGALDEFMRRALIQFSKFDAKHDYNTTLVACNSCFKKRGIKRCLGCLSTQYCSKICQKNHWNEHKKICKSFGAGYIL